MNLWVRNVFISLDSYFVMKGLVIFLILLVVSMPISYAAIFDVPVVGEGQNSEDQLRSEFGTKKFVYAGTSFVASVEDSGIKYYHQGGLSNRLTTDSSGNRDKEFKSLPFGQKVMNSGVDYPFTGKGEDESSLYYFGARYYDDNLGRFTSVDSYGGTGRNLPYAYVANNPMNLVDPSGDFIEGNLALKIVAETAPHWMPKVIQGGAAVGTTTAAVGGSVLAGAAALAVGLLMIPTSTSSTDVYNYDNEEGGLGDLPYPSDDILDLPFSETDSDRNRDGQDRITLYRGFRGKPSLVTKFLEEGFGLQEALFTVEGGNPWSPGATIRELLQNHYDGGMFSSPFISFSLSREEAMYYAQNEGEYTPGAGGMMVTINIPYNPLRVFKNPDSWHEVNVVAPILPHEIVDIEAVGDSGGGGNEGWWDIPKNP
jgi:RHS repeat-associated protein